MFPKDKRKIQHKMRALMKPEELREYVDEKNAFLSLVQDHRYANKKIREKDKVFRENYTRSFIHRSEFASKTLTKFKENVKILNLNTKPLKKKSKE